jgi:PAS domain S-box-containing protein
MKKFLQLLLNIPLLLGAATALLTLAGTHAGLHRAGIFLLWCGVTLWLSRRLAGRRPDVPKAPLHAAGEEAAPNAAEKLLKDNLATLQTVLNNYTGIIWSVDKSGIITTFKGLYLKKIGVTPDFLEGKALSLARHKNRHLDIIEHVDKTLNEGPQEWIAQVDAGMFRFHTTPLYDGEGNLTGVVGSTDDITDIISLQRQLQEAVETANAASRAKSEFLANMSHEIRTPLNAVIGMTIMGKSANTTERKDYCLGKIEDASSHLLGVINDILDMAKIEAGKLELSGTPFCLERVLQHVAGVVGFRIAEKKQRFTVRLDSNIPRCLNGDDQRIAQVIANLLSNAVKFTPEQGAIHLAAALKEEEGENCLIQISVTDTGIGLSPGQRQRLFSSFTQAESSTSRKFGGTGLGLAISKHIVEMMGGAIWVESELGKGSTFAFTMRLAREEVCDPAPPLRLPRAQGVPLRVLVADDQPAVLELFAELAAQEGFSCDAVAGGEDALRLVTENGPYDLYFLDWKMPGMGGISLARELREQDADHSIIVITSAADITEAENKAGDAGINAFLQKPIFPSQVIECIRNYIHLEEEEQPDEAEEAAENFAGHCILLAEDIEINREIMLALLESTRISVDCAENGAQAVRMFSEAPAKYGMIFMDLQMPEMDGYEAARRIREMALPEARAVPIIALSANVFRDDIERCLEVGMNGHIGKPLNLDEVLATLRRHLLG